MPEDLGPSFTSLDYVRMYVEVIGWARETLDQGERERFSTLASYYLDLAYEDADRQRAILKEILPLIVKSAIEAKGEQQPLPTAEEFEALRAMEAVAPVGALEALHFHQMHDLADMMEGWGQDTRLKGWEAASSMGMADGLRSLAEAAGPNWCRDPSTSPSLLTRMARMMYEPQRVSSK